MSGRLVLMGSGELAPTMVATHRSGLREAGTDRVLVIDTPFGFQENADQLTARAVEHFRTSLAVDVSVGTLRTPTAGVVERERLLSAVRASRYVFAGPGSPSYALAVWRQAGLGDALLDVLRAGGTVTFASAAALTVGRKTLPVYEIYKVGSDPHWLDGLDLLTPFGLPATVIPHWNNAEGGNHDTSRCYIGERRLRSIQGELDTGIIGIDEHTAVTVDLHAHRLTVTGNGTVTLRGRGERVIGGGESVGFDEALVVLGGMHEHDHPADPPAERRRPGFEEALAGRDVDAALQAVLEVEELTAGEPDRSRLRSMLVELVDTLRDGAVDRRALVEGYVDVLLDLRAEARTRRRFEESDRIREALARLGVEVRDTGDGVEWSLDG